jgi:hypothetical protein
MMRGSCKAHRTSIAKAELANGGVGRADWSEISHPCGASRTGQASGRTVHGGPRDKESVLRVRCGCLLLLYLVGYVGTP